MTVQTVPATQLRVDIAMNAADRAAARALIASTYLRDYGVVMTDTHTDPDGGVERMPDRLLIGRLGDEVVACAGLYTGWTYVEAFGELDPAAIGVQLRGAGCLASPDRPRVELTKAVVRADARKLGLGRLILGAAHARTFLAADGDTPALLLCGKVSIFRLWRALDIRTRRIREFPLYRNHARYRAPHDPVESRLVIPELDIHPRWYGLSFPAILPIDAPGGLVAH